ncbi:hypothetical protein, partial [Zunongwangia pacifica]
MRIFKFIFQVYLYFGIYTIIFAQPTPESEDPLSIYENLAKDPQVASLSGIIGNVVNEYNGKADINIPIYAIPFGNKNIPITLSYDSGGVKVAQESGWVGLNWNISGQFNVSREIFGFDDFSNRTAGNYQNAPPNGYIYNPVVLQLEEGATRPYLDYNEILNVHHSFTMNPSVNGGSRFMDTQPDVFHLTALGKTYNFILKKKGSSNIIDTEVFNNNNVNITYDLSSEKFTLIDEDGYIYVYGTKTFNTPFYTASQGTPPSSYSGAFANVFSQNNRSKETIVTSWALDKVISPTGREINFSYQKGLHFSFPKYSFSHNGNDYFTRTSWPDAQYFDAAAKMNYSISTSVIENNYLTAITGDFGQVTFHLDGREDLCTGSAIDDLSGGYFESIILYTKNEQIKSCHGESSCINSTNLTAKKLDAIEVKNNNNQTILYADLGHGYFDSNASGIKERFYRLKLNNLIIADKEYNFHYYEENSLPAKDSDGIDFWGFYNGKENENDGLVPRIGRFITSEIRGYNNITYLGQSFVNYAGSNRSSDFNYGKVGLIDKIVLPTKGTVNYEYEPNDAVLSATAPFKTIETFPNSTRLKTTDMTDESKYGFIYQYLKYSSDPNYNYFEKIPVNSSNNTTQVAVDLNEVFILNRPSLLEVNGYIETYTGWDGINYWANYPILVVENVNTGQEYTLFTYADAPSYIGAPQNDVSKSINLPAGDFRIVKRWADIPPGGDYSNYPPIPAVNFYDVGTYYYGVDPNDENLSEILERFEIGGARISKIVSKNGNGEFLHATEYEYDYPGGVSGLTSSGKLMDGLIFFKKASGFQSYTPRDYSYGGSTFVLTGDNQVGGNNSAAGSHIGYSFVRSKKINSNGDSMGWVETQFNNNENQYFTSSFSLPYSWDGITGSGDDAMYYSKHGDVSIQNTILLGLPLKSNFSYINGKILNQKIFDKSGDIQREKVFEYTSLKGMLSNDYFSSFMYVPLHTTTDSEGVVESAVDKTSLGPWGSSHTTYEPYLFPLHYGLVAKLSNSIEYNYSNEDYVTTEIISKYNEDSFLTESIATSLRNNSFLRKEFRYSGDPEVAVIGGVSNLISENRLNTLIKLKEYIDEDLLSTKIYEYENSSNTQNFTMLRKSSFSKASIEMDEVILYHSYDSYGNPIEVSKSDGPHIFYLWGYNGQYPIAKIENMTK